MRNTVFVCDTKIGAASTDGGQVGAGRDRRKPSKVSYIHHNFDKLDIYVYFLLFRDVARHFDHTTTFSAAGKNVFVLSRISYFQEIFRAITKYIRASLLDIWFSRTPA